MWHAVFSSGHVFSTKLTKEEEKLNRYKILRKTSMF